MEPKPSEPRAAPAEGSSAPVVGLGTERRIAWMTPLIGGAAAVPVYFAHRHDWALGLLLGSLLAWLNFGGLRGSAGSAAAARAPVDLLCGGIPLRVAGHRGVCYFYLSARSPCESDSGFVRVRSRGGSGECVGNPGYGGLEANARDNQLCDAVGERSPGTGGCGLAFVATHPPGK